MTLIILFFVTHAKNTCYCQVDGNTELLKKIALFNQSNLDAIRTWSGDIDILYRWTGDLEKDPKNYEEMKWKFHFATDIPGNRSIYLAEQVEASGFREGKSIVNEKGIRWGALWLPDSFQKVPMWEPHGNSDFGKRPTLVMRAKPPLYSEYGHDFHPLMNLKYGGNLAYEVATKWYNGRDKKNVHKYLVFQKGNLVHLTNQQENPKDEEVFDLTKGGNRIAVSAEDTLVKTDIRWDFEKINDVWVTSFYEINNHNKEKKETYNITMKFSNTQVNAPLPEDTFQVQALSQDKVSLISDLRTGSFFADLPKKTNIPSLTPEPSSPIPAGDSPSLLWWFVGAGGMIVALGLGYFLYFRRSP